MTMKRKLRVLQVVDGFRMGGAENKLWELVQHLDGSRFASMIANVGPSGPLEDRFRQLGVPIFDVRRKHRFDLAPIFKLRRICIEQQIDVAQSTLFWADFATALAAQWAKTPVVISWETVTHEGNPYHGKLQRLLGYRVAASRFDRIVAVSHEIKQSLIKNRGLAPDLIDVIHYGVDLEKFRPRKVSSELRRELGAGQDEVLVGVVARLENVKGHRYFVEAFAELSQRCPKARAVFVGDGSERPELQNQIRDRGLEGRIKLMGIRRDIPEILNAIDVFVLPSIAGEGLPNVVLEAMASARPVVATDVGGTAEAVRDGENGFVVPPADPGALAARLEDLVTRPELIRSFGRRSRQIAEADFSLEQQVRSFEELYQSLYLQKTSSKEAVAV